jgi:hypothetical protein
MPDPCPRQILALATLLCAALLMQGCETQNVSRQPNRDTVDPQTGVSAPGTPLQY